MKDEMKKRIWEVVSIVPWTTLVLSGLKINVKQMKEVTKMIVIKRQ